MWWEVQDNQRTGCAVVRRKHFIGADGVSIKTRDSCSVVDVSREHWNNKCVALHFTWNGDVMQRDVWMG